MRVLLLPGFGGTARQPLLVALARELRAAGLEPRIAVPPRARPTPELRPQTDWLLSRLGGEPTAIVGRSFGGRVALRAAAEARVTAVVLLGFPVRPPARPRPLDEALLRGARQPTLVLQGSEDPLGPIEVLRPLVARNPRVTLEVLAGAAHAFGRHEKAARARTVEWLLGRLPGK